MGVLLGIGAALVLKAVFLLARVSWPENYFDSSRRVTHWFLDAPMKVVIWRTVPYLLCALLLVALAEAWKINTTVSLWTFLMAHLATTNLYSIVTSGSRRASYSAQFLYLLVVAIVLAGLTFLVSINSKYVVYFTPDVRGVVLGVWTAIFTGIAFAGFQAMTNAGGSSVGVGSTLGGLKIKDYYVGAAAESALKYSANLPLMLAVIEVESRNRPAPLRRLELWLFRFMPKRFVPKSLGIAQQEDFGKFLESPGREISEDGHKVSLGEVDVKSIEMLAKKLSGTANEQAGERLGPFEIKSYANKVNKTPQYLNAVARICGDMYDGESGFMRSLFLQPQGLTEDDMAMSGSMIADSDAGPVKEREPIQDAEQFDANDSPACGRSDREISEGIECIAPWAVRYGDKVYVQFKISADAIREVVFELLGDSAGRIVLDRLEFSNDHEYFKKGLFELSAKGVALRVCLISTDGTVYVMPTLEYSADRDFSTVESSDW
ncbi:hypothetical protein [Brevibacterium casei]|uniref:hypothetical protein n=1 Tax=Brevibacterium casei TaxID=33889 RepID=UPI0013C33DCB|nr:hypothetical protein [Brevibacterium casei]